MGQRHQRYNILPSFSFQLTLFNVKPHITVIIMQNEDVKMLFMCWQSETFVPKKLQTISFSIAH